MPPCVLNITENCALSASQCTVVPGVMSQRTAGHKCHQQSADICPPKYSKQSSLACMPAMETWRENLTVGLLWTLGRLGTSVPQLVTADVLWCASQFCSLDEQAIPHSCSTRTGSFLSVCVGAAVSNEVDKVMDPVYFLPYISAHFVHCNVK